ncbi:MAG: malto-oligosyltrehalose trehalohydrolase [Methanomicrobiales archaeon]|nr:malto-oligosyltrehalose trehalohydrolase [Methanomicrobiales archaeon]
MRLGARYLGNCRCEFIVWAPFLEEVSVHTVSPLNCTVPLVKDSWGYWTAALDGIPPGTRYLYQLGDMLERPDPASHYQPEGIFGPSEVVDHAEFLWTDDDWRGIPLEELVLYELHVGTFTPEGTFDSILPRLEDLRDVGVNTIVLMPVGQFPGGRNWGYDVVYPFAVQNTYGGPRGLKRLVNACHQHGIAVHLDVIYNHFSPEGTHFHEFGPYWTGVYGCPWGKVVNFDQAYSDEVRNYFLENVLFWLRDYHIDGLRIDAVHFIFDFSAKHFLEEVVERVRDFSAEQGREIHLVAEGSWNDTRYIRSRECGGYGMDATWCDDFHHAIFAILGGGTLGYGQDFGATGDLVKTLKEGFVYSGQYCPSLKRRYGSSTADIHPSKLIAFIQNHDLIGNRMLGERIGELVPFEAQKLAAGTVLLSPYIPLLFMGEEYGERSPFLFFVSYSDPELIDACIRGRRMDFEELLQWSGEPPNPQAVETFERSRLVWERRKAGKHAVLLKFYSTLLRLRKTIPALSHSARENTDVWGLEEERLVFLHRWYGGSGAFCIFNYNMRDVAFRGDLPGGPWLMSVDSASEGWGGPGSRMPERIDAPQDLTIPRFSLALYVRADQHDLQDCPVQDTTDPERSHAGR